MGFPATMILLYPQAYERNGKKLWEWRSSEWLDMGYVTSFKKVIKEGRYKNFDDFYGHKLAGICVASWILGKLFNLNQDPKKMYFAPPIRLDDNFGHSWARYANLYKRSSRRTLTVEGRKMWDWIKSEEKRLENKNHIFWDYSDELMKRIAWDKIVNHNAVLRMNKTPFTKFITNRYTPVVMSPFMWQPCTTIADWLDEMESSGSREWREVSKDPVSTALFRAWRAYLREVGAADVCALMVFHAI